MAAVGLMTLSMCGSLLVGAGAASASWGGTITVSATGHNPLGALDNTGVLHTNYEFTPPHVRGRTVVADVSPGGRVTSGRSALDRAVPALTEIPASTFTFLGNGDAVRCALNRRSGTLSASFYSPKGALIKTAELASGQNIFDLNVEDQCQVVSTGGAAAIAWAVPDASVSAPHQFGRQLLLSRILPGLTLSPPVPVLPSGPDQLTGVDTASSQESIAITKTGWIALDWPYISISKESQTGVSEVTQWRARWMSPAGELGPAIPLEQPRTVTCRFASTPTCAALDTIFHLGAIADQKVMVFVDTQSSWGTLDTAGNVSARKPLPYRNALGSLAFGDYKAIAAWASGDYFKGTYAVTASEWSGGRWSPLHQLAEMNSRDTPYPGQALMSERGEGCVIWYQLTRPFGFGAGVYAQFDG